jgi:hypothetical protein
MHIFAGRCARSDGAGWIGEAATLALIGTMTIGELARRAHVNPRTLRYYERIGLLPEPERLRGQRRYHPDVLGKLGFIGSRRAPGSSWAR